MPCEFGRSAPLIAVFESIEYGLSIEFCAKTDLDEFFGSNFLNLQIVCNFGSTFSTKPSYITSYSYLSISYINIHILSVNFMLTLSSKVVILPPKQCCLDRPSKIARVLFSVQDFCRVLIQIAAHYIRFPCVCCGSIFPLIEPIYRALFY